MAAACLQRASRSFLLGKLNQCTSLLKSLPLIEESVVLEWIQENNLIVCQVDSDETCVVDMTSHTPGSIISVLQKLRGLPACRKLTSLELALIYNYAALTLGEDGRQHSRFDIKEQISRLEKELLVCFQRCGAALGVEESCSELSICEKLARIAAASIEPDAVTFLSLLRCIICIYHLLDGDIDNALCLLEIPSNLESVIKQESGLTLLMKLPHQNLAVRLESSVLTDASFQISSLVHLLHVYSLFHNGQYSSCLQFMQSVKGNCPVHMLPTWEYIKGYCLYQEGLSAEATQVLHNFLSTPSKTLCCDLAMKARCNNLIGCCLIKQGRPSTAMQKFREAIQQDFSNLEPLYNLSLVYRQEGRHDAEVESLNFLVTALENTEADDTSSETASVEGAILPLPYVMPKFSRRQRGDIITHLDALYILAKRCLELHRYNVAAEKYLDLLAVLEERNVFTSMTSRHGSDGHHILPSVEVIYQEAALALYKASYPVDAIVLCDQILSKCTLPAAFTPWKTPAGQCDVASTRLAASSVLMLSPDSPLVKTSQHVTKTSMSDDDIGNCEMFTLARKRQRDDDHYHEGQRSGDTNEWVCSTGRPGKTDLRHLHLYCSVLLLQAQCYKATKELSKVTECLDKILDLLRGMTTCGIPINSSEAVGESDWVESEVAVTGPQLKRRKLDKVLPCNDIESNATERHRSSRPIISSLLEIKAQACNDKALVLIGQGRHQDAMKFLLNSVRCQPGNQDAMYNHTLLLLKIGRKKDAVASLKNFRNVEGSSDRLRQLEKVLDVK